ncbi:MAG: hypothetical protein HKN57_11050 [Xanthomonadales bacterium]|nr:hypothetical protein [Xanthomonadales bacterium]
MNNRFARFLLSAIFFASLPTALLAQSDQGLKSRVYGLNQPARVDDLPPGQMKRNLEALPPQARSKAMKWLQSFAFAAADLNSLNVDSQGGILYADSLVVNSTEAADPVSGTEPGVVPQETLDDAFNLHSRPGAPNRVFIDFDGHAFTDTAWGSGTFDGKAYDLDGFPDTFNATERRRIVDIWHRVAEDLAPFNIDVTTEAPASFDRYTGHILVTHTVDKAGRAMPYNTGGGVAYVGVFGNSNYHTTYSPALVYFNQLGGGNETYVAEASSHEFGHNLGLSHDGTNSGTEYYGGQGSGLVSWAPIMGNSYYNNVTQWSKGEYPDANRTGQDDLAIIDGRLGYLGDDHGDTLATATWLDVAPDGSVVSSNPEQDPHNVLPENKGVIGSSIDVDVFSFVAGAGTVDLVVTPAWDAFYRDTSRRGANLDIDVELRDNSNTVIAASEPINTTSAAISAPVSPGTYYLLVTGTGNDQTPYSDYDSLGQYFINGALAAAAADETAPTPDPMGFASAPTAISDSEISMTALTATDDISTVQYRFNCLAGGQGCAGSGWQAGTSYTASGLAAGSQYTFNVEARDQAGNATAPSGVASATTDQPPAFVDYTSVSETQVSGSVSGTHTATHTDNGSAQVITERESGGKPANRYTYLEHRWNFSIGNGAVVTVFAQAWKSGTNASESFDLEYSTNGGSSYAPLMNISSGTVGNLQSAVLNGSPGGSIIIRATDTHQQSGDRAKSSLHVDHLFIRVDNSGDPPPANPPVTPSGLTATAVSSSAIDLTWVDESSDEIGFTVERSPDGSTNWVEIATLGAGTESHGDVGLDAATQYFYRVSAWNSNGSEGFTTANATTDEADQPGAIVMTANSYKSKGRHGVIIEWTGTPTVDVYRDGNLVASGEGGGSYDDFIGEKGGATYEHQVCAAGSQTNCSNVTTTIF